MALVFLSSLMTWTEGDTRCVVDADMDELPADAEMAVDHAGLSSRDPMAHRADPAELLDIDVDELTRLFPLVTADGLRLQSAQLVQAQTTKTRLTVAGETPTSVAICLPV